jgi:hypothetical protein
MKNKKITDRAEMIFIRIFKFISHKYIHVSLLCFLTPLIFHSINHLIGKNFGMINYFSTSFTVNYFEYGFIRRGFVGSALYLIPSERYQLIALISSILVFFVIVFLFNKLIKNVEDIKTADFLKVAFAISPFTSFQFGYEIGRLDLYNILLMIYILYLVRQHRWLPVLILSLCGLLIHELFAVFGLPLIFSSILFEQSKNFRSNRLLNYKYLATFLICSLVLTFLIFKYGNSELIVTSAPGSGQEGWSRDVKGFWVYDLHSVGWFNFAVTFIVIAGIYICLLKFYWSNNSKLDLFFIAALTPLLLFFVANDYARFAALIGIVAMAIVFIKAIISKWKLTFRYLPYAGLIYVLPLGPIGYMETFPMLRRFIHFIVELTIS